MIARPGKISIRKSNPAMWIPQDIPWRWVAIDAKNESRLRIHVRVTPPIENDPRDVPARIESAGREHVGHLRPKRALMLCERDAEQLRASWGYRGRRL